MKDDTLLLIGLGVASVLYFGSDIKKVTGAVGDVTGSVGKLASAIGGTATNLVSYAQPLAPSENAGQTAQTGSDVLYLATRAIIDYTPGHVINDLFLRSIGR